jgi:tetratricopeptide (TPR) repeat protein
MTLSSSIRRPCVALFLLASLSSVCLRAQTPQEPSPLSPKELAIWNDPAFKKRFAESYMAETDVEPRLDDSEREQMQSVLELISTDKVDAAMELLRVLRAGTNNAVYDFTIANLHFQKEELNQATSSYLTAVEKFPRFRRAWRNLGLIYVRHAEFDKAVPALTRVIELGGADAPTYGLLGFAYASTDNALAAESAYRMASLLDPKAMDWKMGLARSFFKQQRYPDAVALTGTMLAANPERADLWMLQANAYIGMEKPSKAAEDFEVVDRLGKSTVDSLNMLGDIYVNVELFDLAVGAYVRSLEKSPQAKPERAIRAAKALVSRNAGEEARNLMAQITRLRGETLATEEQKDLLKLRARLAVAEGASEEEVKVLTEIVALDPLDGEALILLGQQAGRTGNPEQAVFYYERAASLEKFEADAKVRHAQLLVGQGKYQEALPLLRRAQTIKPRDNIQQYLEQIERVAQGK